MYTSYLDIPESIISRSDFKGLETAYRKYEANNTVANAANFIDEAGKVYTRAGDSGYKVGNPYDTMSTAMEADYAARQNVATDIGVTSTDISGSATDIGSTAKTYVDSVGGAGDNGSRSQTRNKANLDQDTVDRILSTPKGKRPDPSTYFDQDRIDAHLSGFYEGVAKIKANPPKDVEGVGPGTFVMPKSIADEAIAIARGDIRLLEKLLALEPGSLGDHPIRLDIPNPKNLRLPSGNEAGAFPGYWIPGGYTKGGIIEAVIDPVLPGEYIVTPLT